MARRPARHARPNLLQREPVRAYLGGLAAAVVALLVTYGVLDGDAAVVWLGAVTAALAVPAVEGTRARVTPTRARDTGGHA